MNRMILVIFKLSMFLEVTLKSEHSFAHVSAGLNVMTEYSGIYRLD